MQQNSYRRSRLWRRFVLWGCLLSCTPGIVGCTSWFNRKSKDSDGQFAEETKRIQAVLNDPNRPRLIGEVSGVLGIELHRYDSYGLVHGLPNTGGTVKPGQPRTMMLTEMRRKELNNPEQVLDSTSTALVKVQAISFPGSRKGDLLDINVECSTECNASSLAGGFLLDTYLREMVTVGGGVRQSEDKATASGDIVVLPPSFSNRELEPLKAIIIGGGRLIQNRQLHLHLNPGFKHTFVVKKLETAINDRFYFNDASKQQLVAEGKSDYEVLLRLPPKYRYDVGHFANVVITTGFHETPENQQERIQGCAELIKDRSTARRAAAELEAIGNKAAIDVLMTGLSSIEKEVRFFSAYSLAYLDCKEATPVLLEMAKKEPAFRRMSLVGLTINEHESGREALERLLQEETPELRYGALWGLRNRDESSTTYNGERLVASASLLQIPSTKPLVAVSLQTKPEVVVFGNPSPVNLSTQISPSPLLTLTPMPGNQIRIVKKFYDLNDPTLQTDFYNEIVPGDFVSLMRALTYVGANYNEVVHTIEALQSTKALTTPVAFNPRPDASLILKRDTESAEVDRVETMTVDASTRNRETKSWWDFSGWLTKSPFSSSNSATSTKTEATSETKTVSSAANESVIQASHSTPTSLPATDLDKKVKSVSESLDTRSSSMSDSLPEIDWDALK